MIKYLITVVIVSFSLIVTWMWGRDVGQKEGLDMYHNQCFDVGGYVINNTGKVVKCGPIVVIPKEERNLYNITIDKT